MGAHPRQRSSRKGGVRAEPCHAYLHKQGVVAMLAVADEDLVAAVVLVLCVDLVRARLGVEAARDLRTSGVCEIQFSLALVICMKT